MRISSKDAAKLGIIGRTLNKFKVAPAKERTANGRVYASKAEMLYANMLYDQMRAGEIIEVIEQPSLWLGVPENKYRPDFLIVPAGAARPYYVDVKGMETSQFKHVKKLWAKYGRLDLQIVKRKGDKFVTLEVISNEAE